MSEVNLGSNLLAIDDDPAFGKTLLGILKKMGYRVFLPLQGKLEEVHRYIPHEYDRQNYFFLHREKHADQISTNLSYT